MRLALKKLLGTILSSQGMAMVQEQMAADEGLRTRPRISRPGGFPGTTR